jgi:hypothetical protein
VLGLVLLVTQKLTKCPLFLQERILNDQLILADDDKVINDRVRLPEGETGDELISLVNADIDVRELSCLYHTLTRFPECR